MISEPLQPLAVDISMLTTLEKNPRRGEVKAIMRSLERFGQRKPIVALPNGTVIAGNHTLMAARELGWDEIAVTFSDDDPQTAKAFALADNRTGDLGTYDEEILAELLVEVSDDPELLLATGYTEADVDALLGGTQDVEITDFPELPTGEREPFQQMTFTLHDDEVAWIENAIAVATETTVEQQLLFTSWLREQKVTATQINEATGTFMGGHYLTPASQPAIPTPDAWKRIAPLIPHVPEWVTELIERKERIKMSDNENGRGSALARICSEWVDQVAKR